MRNILISLFILSCLSVNIAYAYEKKNAQTQGASISPAGVKAVGSEVTTTDHNKTKEEMDKAKDELGLYNQDNNEEEAGKEAKETNKEQALDKVDQKLIDTAKETEQVEIEEQVDENLMDDEKEVIDEDEKMKEKVLTPEKK